MRNRYTNVLCPTDAALYVAKQAFSKAPQPRLHSIFFLVQVVIVEEDSNVLVKCCRNVLREELVNLVAVFKSLCCVRIRAEAVHEDDTRQ
ncbi:unnamed protein product [Periconia digitata]|uniref:Uncharacterized protein n=1 Tax=Periconia digitata TaxID=1303443 RepID=A0A9W4U2E7_9PLEO|nr:unnamed protein product [Periconia digitata]